MSKRLQLLGRMLWITVGIATVGQTWVASLADAWGENPLIFLWFALLVVGLPVTWATHLADAVADWRRPA